MIATACLAIVAVSKPDPVEYVDIECSPGAIPVDCNNIQTTPLKLKALYRAGGSSAPYEIFWKLSIQSVGTELGTAESPGGMSEWEYLLPSDKWGKADSVVVEGYQESSYKTLLVLKSIGISRQNPSPFPIEGEWKPLPFKYKNGEYFLDSETGFIFMWMDPVPGNSEIRPFDDVQHNPLTTSWEQHQEYPLLGTRLLLAEKIKAEQIDADNLIVKVLDTLSENGIHTRIDKNGIVMSRNGKELIRISTWEDNDVLPNMVMRFGNQTLDFKAIGISLSEGEVNRTWLGPKGLQVVMNDTVLARPRLIWVAKINSYGTVGAKYPYGDRNTFTFSVERYEKGFYKVRHNLNSSNYFVQLSAVQNGKLTFALLERVTSNEFIYSINSLDGGVWDKADADCYVSVIYNPSFIYDA